MDEAIDQFFTEAVASSVEPWEEILGGVCPGFQQKALSRVEVVAARIQAGGPGAEALASAMVAVIFGAGDIPPAWWRTPLGLLLGPILPDAGMTQAEAATALGVERGTVGTRVRRGNLARFGDAPAGRRGRPPGGVGEVSRRAVALELSARATRRWRAGVMTPLMLADARARRARGESFASIGAALGVSRNTVWRALTDAAPA